MQNEKYLDLVSRIQSSGISARVKNGAHNAAGYCSGSFGVGLDSMDRIFTIQKALNDLIFERHDLRAKDNSPLTAEKMIALGKEPFGPNSTSIEWISKFITALKDEVRELEEEIPWKWWSKDPIDIQNIRVEITDLLFFIVCLAQAAGLESEDLVDLYQKKAIINLDRQFKNYSKATKDELDNKGIEVAK